MVKQDKYFWIKAPIGVVCLFMLFLCFLGLIFFSLCFPLLFDMYIGNKSSYWGLVLWPFEVSIAGIISMGTMKFLDKVL